MAHETHIVHRWSSPQAWLICAGRTRVPAWRAAPFLPGEPPTATCAEKTDPQVISSRETAFRTTVKLATRRRSSRPLRDPLDENLTPERAVREIMTNRSDSELLGADTVVRSLTLCRRLGRTFRRSHGWTRSMGALVPIPSRLLLTDIPKGTDRNEEFKRRLRMWEAGNTHNWCSGCLATTTQGARRQKQRQSADTHRRKNSAGNGPVH